MTRMGTLGMVLAASAAVWTSGCARRMATQKPAAPPTSVATNMRRQILNAADAGEGDAVVNRLRREIAARPDDLASRLELAAHYGRRGLPELELEHLRVAAERFPSSAAAQMALAQSLRKAGEPRAAAESLAAFLAVQPSAGGAEAYNLLGVCLDEAGDWKAGEMAFRRAVAAAPLLDYPHNNLGYNLLEQRRTADAADEFRQALKLNPRSETARNNLGVAVAQTPGAAISEALRHFESVTDAATAHNNLAAALIEQGRHQESRQLLEAALGHNRAHAPALGNLKLVSELDGQPAHVRAQRNRNGWLRPLAFLRWVFLPGEERRETQPGGAEQFRVSEPKKGE